LRAAADQALKAPVGSQLGGDHSAQKPVLLNEPDPKMALPHKLRETVDGIRNFGNFSAHPIMRM
jgi:hypothetical protein